MTDTEIRIAIAEKCGWHTIQQNPMYPLRPECLAGFHRGDNTALCGIPNYPNDANAVAEVLATLTELQRRNCAHVLEAMMVGPNDRSDSIFFVAYNTVYATARQRCEALLRTWGLWKE